MFERSIEKELERWGNDVYRKPLVLRGARQVGKTTIVNRFGGTFDNFLSVNLEKSEARRLFESTDKVRELLSLLFLYCNVKRSEGRTLFFAERL
jgi:predicted AAA+ superfamily ATPase